MEEYNKIGYWIEDLPKKGKITFTKKEVEQQFPGLKSNNIQMTLYRLVLKKKIQSVWRGFWVVVPVEYGLKGIVDPIEYIAQLMNYLGHKYYIGLLSAAAIHGAAHQQSMELMLITDSKHLREKVKNDVKISFVTKKGIPLSYLQEISGKSGYIPVSTPELTAIDLLLYIRNVGGINRVATVLNELAEVVDFEKISSNFFYSVNTADIQRLGFLLEKLGFIANADSLYRKSQEANLKFRKHPICIKKQSMNLSEYPVNKKWKIIINEEIDTDEL